MSEQIQALYLRERGWTPHLTAGLWWKDDVRKPVSLAAAFMLESMSERARGVVRAHVARGLKEPEGGES